MRGRGVKTITASLEIGNAVRPAANSSLNAGAISHATPRRSIATSPRISYAQFLPANFTRSALLARTSSRVTTRTPTRESFSMASLTRSSSPRPAALLKSNSLSAPKPRHIWWRKSVARDGFGRNLGFFALTVVPILSVFHGHTFFATSSGNFLLAHSHYEDWCGRGKGVLSLYRASI